MLEELLAYVEQELAAELALMQTGGYLAACPELTAAEKAVIYKYTKDGSMALNEQLHQEPGRCPLWGQGIAAALAKLPPYQGPIVRSAGYLSPAQLQLYYECVATGTAVVWPAFFSTSASAAVARQHLGYGRKNVLFLITAPRTGRLVEALSHYGPNGPDPYVTESEVLFAPGTWFRVLEVKPATGYLEIVLEEQ
jgi:hypothetical protein